MKHIKLIECPRDAMQGWSKPIDTSTKIRYHKALLKVGFDVLDCGSFVSPKAIPQMADSSEVIAAIGDFKENTKLSVIVANLRGAQTACTFEAIDILGFPFSISENFQMRNTGKTIQQSLQALGQIVSLAQKNNKMVTVYLSMGFGNPYGDPWHPDIVAHWVTELQKIGVVTISLSDTVGMAQTETIATLFSHVIPAFPSVEFGAHFHTTPDGAIEKVAAAYQEGCLCFDGAIQGVGGCPMAQNQLVGNMPTEKLISFFEAQKCSHSLHLLHFESAYNVALDVFKGA